MHDLDFPVFIISLSDATERRENISNSLISLNIPYTFFDAVDGRRGMSEGLLKRVDREAAFKRLGREMTDGEIACALSHLSVYEHIIKKKLPGAIILEDDAVIGKTFKKFINERCYLRKRMILLGYERAWVEKKATSEHLFEDHNLHKLFLPTYLAVGYSIDFYAAETLAAKIVPITKVADWSYDITKLEAHVVCPVIVGHWPENLKQSFLHSSRQKALDKGHALRKRSLLNRVFKIKYLKRKYRNYVAYKLECGSYSASKEIMQK